MKLTPKQQRFVDEYLIDLNATAAAKRAGYSERTSSEMGYENLRKPQISAAIAEKAEKLQAKTGLTLERTLKEIERLAFFDPRKLFNSDGSLIPVHELDDDSAAALAALEVNETSSDESVISYTKKVKWHDKNSALDKAMRHFGAYKDRLEHTGKDGKDLNTFDPLDIARRMVFILQAGTNQLEKTNGKTH